MSLDRVTITGVDDSTRLDVLLELSARYPFVEWGVLVSRSNIGSPRYPSAKWINDFRTMALQHNLRCSLHVCGHWVRQLLLGIDELPGCVDGFQRIQLNFHAERTPCVPALFGAALEKYPDRQFIFQIDGASGNAHLDAIYRADPEHRINAVPLFDVSGGAGILPEEWPRPVYGRGDRIVYHGFAGGLGPSNLAEQLPLIANAAGPHQQYWVDMETRVRSKDDLMLDPSLVELALDKCAAFIDGQRAEIIIERKLVESSNIKSVGYSAEHEMLDVEFGSGGVYRYVGVPPAIWDGLVSAESVGRYFQAIVRPRFEGKRLP